MASSNDELYARALELARDVDDTFLDLGNSLRKLMDRDPDLFQKLVEKSRLGRRKAYYLVEIARVFANIPAPRARLKQIGWTKLQVIAKKVTKDNIDELLKLCEDSTVQQLTAMMKGETPKNNAHCVLMYFTPKQYAELEEKLLKNGGVRSGRGILNKEEALLKALRDKNHNNHV